MYRSRNLAAAGLLGLALGLAPAGAETLTWTGLAGDWSAAENWTNTVHPELTRVPAAGDDVVIDRGGAQVELADSTDFLGSLAISNATLVFSNWDTLLSATQVTVRGGGILTCAGPFTNTAMSNRVNLLCSNLLVEAGGAISVDGKGFAGGVSNYYAGHGPGGGLYFASSPRKYGGSYGGAGINGEGVPIFATNTYGSAERPLEPGSGGCAGSATNGIGGAGGGAVCITADQVVVSGRISANGGLTSGQVHNSAGSGGGIYIVCRTIHGTNGSVTADAGLPRIVYNYNGGGAGGGRIAVHYDPDAQRALSVPALWFSVAPSASAPASLPDCIGEIGTLYFPDLSLLSPSRVFAGQWIVPGLTNLSVSELTVSNAWVRFPAAGLALTVTNALTVVGTNARLCRLEITNAAVSVSCGQLQLDGAALQLGYKLFRHLGYTSSTYNLTTSGPALTCAGDLTLTNGAAFNVSAGLTCSGAEAGYGAEISIGGDILVATNCWISPMAHSTNGAAVLFSARNLALQPGGGINADAGGYAGGIRTNSSPPFGPGVGVAYAGSGHGGQGAVGLNPTYPGTPGPTYGDSNAPVEPGSGGRAGAGSGNFYEDGAFGGGSVQIRASGTVSVGGTISAGALKPGPSGTPGASGGAIYIVCRTFIGEALGVVQALGGPGCYPGPTQSSGGGGGGGRIALWRVNDLSDGGFTLSVEGGVGAGATGDSGTVVQGWLPAKGTLIKAF